MLVITRKKDESVIIGENIEIRILDIQKGKVKIAIDAPREISVIRKEIIQEVSDTNKKAGVLGSLDIGGLADKIKIDKG